MGEDKGHGELIYKARDRQVAAKFNNCKGVEIQADGVYK